MTKTFGRIADFQLKRDEQTRVVICYDYREIDSTNATWRELPLNKKQNQVISFDLVRQAIIADINARTDEKILSGFAWNDKPVWLSSENQFNFSEADRKAEKNADILPITFKIGEQDGTPVYHTFETYEELDGFYTLAFAYINQCLVEGWAEKDAIDWAPYAALFPAASEASAAAE